MPRDAPGSSRSWLDSSRGSARANQQWVAARVLCKSSAARRSCRSNSTSDGVSIRGVFEVASFRPGKAIEAESDALPPSLFKSRAMFRSQCPYLGLIRSQLCRIGLSGQYRGSFLPQKTNVRSAHPARLNALMRRSFLAISTLALYLPWPKLFAPGGITQPEIRILTPPESSSRRRAQPRCDRTPPRQPQAA